MDLQKLLKHPIVAAIRYLQLALAVCVYLFFALSGLQNIAVVVEDSVLHFVGNILLFSSIWLATYFILKLRWQLALSIPFALSVEAAQMLTSTRQVDMYDAGINLAGLLVGATVCHLIHIFVLKKRHSNLYS